MADNILKFSVEIKDNATRSLDEIEARLNKMAEHFKTSVQNINGSIGSIGRDFNPAVLAELSKQLSSIQTSAKKDVGDIPLFKTVLEQMQSLKNAVDKTTLPKEIEKIRNSLHNLFAEVPKVSPASFNAYFQQLSSAYEAFKAKIGSGKGVDIGGVESGMKSLGSLRSNESTTDNFSHLKQIREELIRAITDINASVENTKKLLSGKSLNFSKISDNVDKLTKSIDTLSQSFRELNGVVGKDQGILNVAAGLGVLVKNLQASVNALRKGDSNLNVRQSLMSDAKSFLQARAELEKLEPLMEKLHSQRLLSRGLGLDTRDIDAAIEKVRALQELLRGVVSNRGVSSEGVDSVFFGLRTKDIMFAHKEELQSVKNALSTQTQANSQALSNQKQAAQENAAAKKEAERADAELVQRERELSQAIRRVTDSAHGQSQVISDLKSMAMQYLSVWGAQQFVSDMVNITGELELQQKSLEVILDNASAAQKMYSEIRDLSQMSPYTFEDLLKSHRQLAAFGIEAKDIFSTLKSLSDIGAGLDVDVSRLILAYGHTRSYGYLSGIQNRQFETAGIDLVGALTAMYNRRANEQKKEGKQFNFVNRKDIFSRMRERSIPFEDVQEVILGLDKPGGKFYDMQIRQFETLGGKLRNLRNNYRIMMSEIGDSNKGILSFSVGVINELTENWERYARVLKGVAVGYGAIRLAALSTSAAEKAANKALYSKMLERSKIDSSTRFLNGEDVSIFGNSGRKQDLSRNNYDIRNLAKDKEINNAFKQRIALTGKLTKAQRELLLVSAGVDSSRAKAIAQMGSLRRGLMSLRIGMMGVAASAKAMMAALLTNPLTWIFGAISAITWLVDKMGKGAEEAANFKKNLAETAETDVKGMVDFLDPYRQSGMLKTTDKHAVRGGGRMAIHETVAVNKAELEAEGVDTVFEELKNRLQTASPMYEGDFFDVMKASSQADQVEGMFQKLEDIKFAKQIEQQTADELGTAIESTAPTTGWHVGEWYKGEGVITNMSDYAKDRADFVNSIRVSEDEWNTFLDEDKRAIGKYMRDLGVARNEAIAKYLLNSNKKVSELSKGLAGYAVAAYNVNYTLSEAKGDIETVADGMASILINKFGDNISAGSSYITDVFTKMLTEASVGSPDAQAELFEVLNEALFQSLSRSGNAKYANAMRKRFFQQAAASLALASLDAELRPDMNDKEVTTSAKESSKQTIEALKTKSKAFKEWLEKMGKEAANLFVKGVEEQTVNAAHDKVRNALWQQFYRDAGVNVPETETNYYAFVEKLQKELADNFQKILAQKHKLVKRFQLDIDFDLNDKEAVRKLAKLVTNLNKAIHDTWERHNRAKGDDRRALMNDIEYLRGVRDQARNMHRVAKRLTEDDQPLVNDKTKKKGSRGGGSYRDPFVTRWDERIRVLKEANNVYESWEKRVGRSAAIERVKKQFAGIFASWKKDKYLPMNIDVNDIDDIRKYVEQIKREAERRYEKQRKNKNLANGEQAMRVLRQAEDVINSIDSKMFDKKSDEWFSKTSLWLSRLTKKWEVYQKVLKATGDQILAMSLSGFNIDKYQNEADAIRSDIMQRLEETDMKNGYVFNEDDSDVKIEEDVKRILGSSTSKEKIKSFIEEIKKWRDLQQKITEESKGAFATTIGGIDNYINKLHKANAEYDELLRKVELLKNNDIITERQYNAAIRIVGDKRDRTIYEASAPYKQLVGSTLTNSIDWSRKEGEKAKLMIEKQFIRGSISAEEFVKKIKEINDALDKTSRSQVNGVVRFVNENAEQRHTRKADEHYEKFQNTAREYEELSGKKAAALARGDMRVASSLEAQMVKKKKDMIGHLGKAEDERGGADKAKKLSDTINAVIKELQNFQNGLNLLGNIFDSLGMGGAAQIAGDAAGVAGSALQGASALSFLGPHGQMAGAALGLIGGVAQLHDKGIARKIEEMKAHVANIDAYTEIISRAQERTLGYNRGDEVTRLYQMYAKNNIAVGRRFYTNKEGAAGIAMQRFYGAAQGEKEGYSQQLALLKEKRKEYIDMYNAENSKKKSSEKDMLEYKKQIAELDDKIMHFAEDVSKSLWGIDVKGWADQISDALCTAFENGEDAMDAYKNSAEDIMRSVVHNLMKLGVVQPMFEKLRKELFGFIDEKGKYHAGIIDMESENPFGEDAAKTGSMLASVTAKRLNEDMIPILTTFQEAMQGWERTSNDQGYSLKKNKGSKDSLSSGIQGTSEETSNLLAAYVNALRQDVAYIRLVKTQFADGMWKDYVKQVTGMNETLARIDSNVAAIRSVISENGALYGKVEQMASDLHNVIFGNERIKIA